MLAIARRAPLLAAAVLLLAGGASAFHAHRATVLPHHGRRLRALGARPSVAPLAPSALAGVSRVTRSATMVASTSEEAPSLPRRALGAVLALARLVFSCSWIWLPVSLYWALPWLERRSVFGSCAELEGLVDMACGTVFIPVVGILYAILVGLSIDTLWSSQKAAHHSLAAECAAAALLLPQLRPLFVPRGPPKQTASQVGGAYAQAVALLREHMHELRDTLYPPKGRDALAEVELAHRSAPSALLSLNRLVRAAGARRGRGRGRGQRRAGLGAGVARRGARALTRGGRRAPRAAQVCAQQLPADAAAPQTDALVSVSDRLKELVELRCAAHAHARAQHGARPARAPRSHPAPRRAARAPWRRSMTRASSALQRLPTVHWLVLGGLAGSLVYAFWVIATGPVAGAAEVTAIAARVHLSNCASPRIRLMCSVLVGSCTCVFKILRDLERPLHGVYRVRAEEVASAPMLEQAIKDADAQLGG